MDGNLWLTDSLSRSIDTPHSLTSKHNVKNHRLLTRDYTIPFAGKKGCLSMPIDPNKPILQSTKRRFTEASAALTAAYLVAPFKQSMAQTSAAKILVGFAAGGSLDLLARMAAEGLSSKLGKPFIVENKTGASGRLAVESTKTAKPDGDTLLVCPQGPLTLFPYIFKNMKFDPFKDLTPIARLCTFDVAISIGPSSGADSMQKFVAWIKANSDKANFGSSGAGTLLHFTGISLSQKIGVPLTHVGYKGSAPAVVDLIAGSVPMVVSPLSDVLENHKAGRLKVIAISSPQRSILAPDVPTLKEVGIDVEVPGWFALYGPAGMATELVKRYNLVLADTLAPQAVKDRLHKMGMISAVISPDETSQLQRKEHLMWGPLVKASGFTPED
jgi:tripartite-type tricarboxylate transporter receptor subunit TctC